ncbi:hypothetical protein [Bradyrhizobium sp. STM 3809]|uniref:hypothetical protein n=1 Tax=Bradyrhizobium sp. STM 3809 TaxID=551936 RepID=UPI000240920A|nr:hypothetical protein [Bradyrhizobium sp. STM 3809]CCE00368.1 exported hypothetical protein [Bradyrhizobium sp. STM 3809]
MRRLAAISTAITGALSQNSSVSAKRRHHLTAFSFGLRLSLTKCGIARSHALYGPPASLQAKATALPYANARRKIISNK